jgi:hypothetical protein
MRDDGARAERQEMARPAGLLMAAENGNRPMPRQRR